MTSSEGVEDEELGVRAMPCWLLVGVFRGRSRPAAEGAWVGVGTLTADRASRAVAVDHIDPEKHLNNCTRRCRGCDGGTLTAFSMSTPLL